MKFSGELKNERTCSFQQYERLSSAISAKPAATHELSPVDNYSSPANEYVNL